MEIKATNLLGEIIAGEHDGLLDEIANMIRERKRILRDCATTAARFTLNVGDVCVLHGLSPQYINGSRVEVREIMKTRASVKLLDGADPRAVRRFGYGCVRVPLACIEAE